ncbi:Lrp/AsnC ligand binding domain-containing protein [Spiribacter vilamensis]|uniref:Leucine-responsive regulatory protein n=1 Tax=Spiribacter vilamensis TaxID=531306 RepID=A0A4Q8D253_9GAMM|nr:Lrp/AsnC ligand binding domain-containing protein [Spiribacter vilamensis]RZU99370.1 Lrp/AsnC family leucine-responsive transcriptional regulator [Spiribacter vilamensis]TVO61650.1 AsnC family transcriptional regulator [Spiribacter vilamensis]
MTDEPARTAALDRLDQTILRVLSVNGRISVAELARRIGRSKTPTQARLQRLEKNRVIRGYRAILDPIGIGAAHVAFVEVRLSDTRESALKDFNEAARGVPEIEECHLIAGGFDYLLKVRTPDISSYRRVLADSISSLPHVASTSTYVAMEAVKELGP